MKEPIDYLFNIIGWILVTPMKITENSNKKAFRVIGRLMCFPFAITWVITMPLVSIILTIMLIAQMFYD